jgi:DNA-binding NarL/FixJ family response regulator
MFPPESDLIKQINTVIKKKFYKKGRGVSDLSEKSATAHCTRESFTKNHNAYSTSAASSEKLEERITALEELNNHLLYFISLLIVNPSVSVFNSLKSTFADWQLMNKNEKTLKSKQYRKNGSPLPTKREKDVLDLLIKGFCAKEIAKQLFISETTVITHKKNLKEKFNAKNTVELISKTVPLSAKDRFF